MDTGKWIIDAAIANGASCAGIADMAAVRTSASHVNYTKMDEYTGVGTVKEQDLVQDQLFNWPEAARSVLVIGLSHPKEKPELDWWDGKGTPGNRELIRIIDRTSRQIEDHLKLNTRKLHYYVERGGLFLKDAAVLAGLGCIGKNNMLVNPVYGPRIRLRALFLDADIPSTGPISFDPCDSCKIYCRKVCPEKAMSDTAPIFKSNSFSGHPPARDGMYDRRLCNIRMEKDVAERGVQDHSPEPVITYCRKCEFVCPTGRH